jgi:hypothetical protein
MLLEYLTELKNSLSEDDFYRFMKDVTNDIKVNRVAFNKKTSQAEFKDVCKILLEVLDRC